MILEDVYELQNCPVWFRSIAADFSYRKCGPYGGIRSLVREVDHEIKCPEPNFEDVGVELWELIRTPHLCPSILYIVL